MMMPGLTNQGMMGQAALGSQQLAAEQRRLEEEKKARRQGTALQIAQMLLGTSGLMGSAVGGATAGKTLEIF